MAQVPGPPCFPALQPASCLSFVPFFPGFLSAPLTLPRVHWPAGGPSVSPPEHLGLLCSYPVWGDSQVRSQARLPWASPCAVPIPSIPMWKLNGVGKMAPPPPQHPHAQVAPQAFDVPFAASGCSLCVQCHGSWKSRRSRTDSLLASVNRGGTS